MAAGGPPGTQGFRPTKSMGQCFLVDGNITEKIIRSTGFSAADGVLEVGPGFGILTRALSSTAGRVVAVELDGRLLPALRESTSAAGNVDIIHGDILKTDVAELVNDKLSGLRKHVCANLPYNITTPALSLFIESGVFQTITVMIQREVAQRICAKPGTPEYGSFTVFANYHVRPEILFTVPPECFSPRPRVYSAVVRMETLRERMLTPEEEPLFFRVVRAAFHQRRKTLVNALFSAFGRTHKKDEIADVVRACGFNEMIRGETLSIEEFAKLSRFLRSKPFV